MCRKEEFKWQFEELRRKGCDLEKIIRERIGFEG